MKIINFLQSKIKNAFASIIEAQQRKAECEIARMLQVEYKHESYDYILNMVRSGKIEEISKNVK